MGDVRNKLPKNLPMPRCPGCGERMELADNLDAYGYADFPVFWFDCKVCRWSSPEMATVKDAYAIAMRRWHPRNRLLTEKEIRESASVWCEEKIECGMTVLDPMLVVSATSRHYVELITTDAEKLEMNVADLNIKWRCWMRKPSFEEMDAVAWKEGAEDGED